MQQPSQKPPENFLASQNSKLSIGPEDILKVKSSFPFLKGVKENDENFIILVGLLKELANTKYESDKKYELMYKIIKIENLMESLVPHLPTKSPVDKLMASKDNVPVKDFGEEQQMALFILARNNSADFFNIFYEKQAKELIENFSGLCNGVGNPTF